MTDPSRSALLPIASYRVQLTPEHGFAHAVGLLDHLVSLGISHVYLSPVTEAVPGSTHGYDVVDHTRVRAELGGAEGLDRLLEAAASRGMSVIIDHVPNHCSTSRPELNAPWWSMLRDGPGSAAAAWFDVDRTHPTAGGRVLLAVLRAPLDQVLADGGV
ncbi:MAG: malto-oligosyltrehalose synthase, partial [Nocardiopsis sp. BM-2018]